MMNTKALKAFAVVCDEFAHTQEQLAVAASDGVQLAVYATRPAAVERLSIAGELVLDVAIIPAADFDRVTAERDALQLRLNAADQRADELVELLCDIKRHDPDTQCMSYPMHRRIADAISPASSQAGERCHEIPGTSGQRLNQLACEGE